MEVLELTQEVAEPTPPLPEPEPVAAPEPPKVEEPAKTRTDEIVFEPIARREPAADNDIFSDQTRRAMEDTFDSIPDEPEEPAPRPP